MSLKTSPRPKTQKVEVKVDSPTKRKNPRRRSPIDLRKIKTQSQRVQNARRRGFQDQEALEDSIWENLLDRRVVSGHSDVPDPEMPKQTPARKKSRGTPGQPLQRTRRGKRSKSQSFTSELKSQLQHEREERNSWVTRLTSMADGMASDLASLTTLQEQEEDDDDEFARRPPSTTNDDSNSTSATPNSSLFDDTRIKMMKTVFDLCTSIGKEWEKYEESVEHNKANIEKNIVKLEMTIADYDLAIRKQKAHYEDIRKLTEKYNELLTKLEESRRRIETEINSRTFAEIKNLPRPPVPLQHVIIGVMLLIGLKLKKKAHLLKDSTKNLKAIWGGCKAFLTDPSIKSKMLNLRAETLDPNCVQSTRDFVEKHRESFVPARIRRASRTAEPIAKMVLDLLDLQGILIKVGDIENFEELNAKRTQEIRNLEAKRAEACSELATYTALLAPIKTAGQQEKDPSPIVAKMEKVISVQKDALALISRTAAALANPPKQVPNGSSRRTSSEAKQEPEREDSKVDSGG